jgi:hypothetical protein
MSKTMFTSLGGCARGNRVASNPPLQRTGLRPAAERLYRWADDEGTSVSRSGRRLHSRSSRRTRLGDNCLPSEIGRAQ